jgi:single-strand DNA-binding protein
MFGTTIFVVGNATDDAELRYTPSGVAVCNFSVAVNNRTKKGDEWVDGEPSFYRVAVWRDYGENVAETVKKGDQVLVYGRLMTRTWTDQEQQKHTSLDITADEVAVPLRWATAKVTKVRRNQDAAAKGDFNDEAPF